MNFNMETDIIKNMQKNVIIIIKIVLLKKVGNAKPGECAGRPISPALYPFVEDKRRESSLGQ